jgi:hypothetical protein
MPLDAVKIAAIHIVPDVDAFPDGTSLADMGAALDLPVVAIRQVLEHGFVAHRGRRTGIVTDDVVAMRVAGWSQVAIAYAYGCSEATVSRGLKQAGVI